MHLLSCGPWSTDPLHNQIIFFCHDWRSSLFVNTVHYMHLQICSLLATYICFSLNKCWDWSNFTLKSLSKIPYIIGVQSCHSMQFIAVPRDSAIQSCLNEIILSPVVCLLHRKKNSLHLLGYLDSTTGRFTGKLREHLSWALQDLVYSFILWINSEVGRP